jgi:hypothetical protein
VEILVELGLTQGRRDNRAAVAIGERSKRNEYRYLLRRQKSEAATWRRSFKPGILTNTLIGRMRSLVKRPIALRGQLSSREAK